MKKVILFVAVFSVCIFCFASPLFAFTVKSGENLNISESIEDDVYAFSNTVTLTGNVEGDFISAGSQINISGLVKGDLIAAGGSITVNGEIDDTARLAGGAISIDNNLKKDLIAAGGQIEISSNSTVNGDVVMNAARIIIDGNVDGKLKLSAGDVTINGKIGDDVQIKASNIEIGENAEIKGDFDYSSEREATIASGAKITGKTNWTKIETDTQKQKIEITPFKRQDLTAIFTTAWIGVKVISFLSSFVLGIILLLMTPWAFKKFNERMKSTLGNCVGGGAIFLFGAPVAMFILALIGIILFCTIIGASLGGLTFITEIFLILTYALFIFVSNIFLSFFIGNLILQKGVKNLDKKYGWKVLAYFIGLVIMTILYVVPFIGWIIRFVGLLFGLGGLVMISKDWLVSFKKSSATN
jgi:cytoskeletal protein CcmA (bactofilin family)